MSTNSPPRPGNRPTANPDPHNINPLRGVVSRAGDTLIPGIYQTCDQWCIYCPASHRCLAFQSTNASEVDGVWDPAEDADAERVGEGMLFMKALSDAEGLASPPEVEALLSGDPERQRTAFTVDDPLEHLGRDYMALAEAYLKSRTDFPPPMVWRSSGPTPSEVLTWYHVFAPARVFRAILCANEAAAGVAGRHRDALCAARVALVGVDRSLSALATIASEDDDPRVELLQTRLRRFRDAIDARFPDARAFIRPGLDRDPPATSHPLMRRLIRRVGALLHWRHERFAAAAPPGDVRGSACGPGAPRG